MDGKGKSEYTSISISSSINNHDQWQLVTVIRGVLQLLPTKIL